MTLTFPLRSRGWALDGKRRFTRSRPCGKGFRRCSLARIRNWVGFYVGPRRGRLADNWFNQPFFNLRARLRRDLQKMY